MGAFGERNMRAGSINGAGHARLEAAASASRVNTRFKCDCCHVEWASGILTGQTAVHPGGPLSSVRWFVVIARGGLLLRWRPFIHLRS